MLSHRHRPGETHAVRNTCRRTIMELLGHSAIAVTMDIYPHVRLDVLRSAADRMDGVLGDES